MRKTFLAKINDQKPAIGTMVTLESPEVAEVMSLAGFDWLFLDMEHGPSSILGIQHSIQAIRNECSAIVRIPDNAPVWIKKVLDTGCDGIIIPHVNNAEDALLAVMAAKYPPIGTRSVGLARAQGYGMSASEYISSANERIAVIILIEHIEAVNNLETILAVKGIDGVLIGPFDLSGSMNMFGQVGSEPVQQAINTIKQKCKEKAIPFGIFVLNAEAAQREIDSGCKFIAVGMDVTLLGNAAKGIVDAIKETTK